MAGNETTQVQGCAPRIHAALDEVLRLFGGKLPLHLQAMVPMAVGGLVETLAEIEKGQTNLTKRELMALYRVSFECATALQVGIRIIASQSDPNEGEKK